MFVRLGMDYDVDDFVRMSVANLEETMPGEPYSTVKIRETYWRYMDTAQPTVWFVEHRRQVIGFMIAYMFGFDYRDGLYTTQRVIYVSPENRGTRAAVLLARELVRWSKSLNAAKIEGGNDNSFNSERTAGFLEHFGFKRVGYAMRLLLEERGDGRQEQRR
jgi:L-amino acid N-acyltransferase YncA